MTAARQSTAIPAGRQPATVVRLFGWIMLAVLAAYIINNFLVVGWGMSTIRDLIAGGTAASFAPAIAYVVCIAIAIGFVVTSSHRGLRRDAMAVHAFNCYLIRAFFWIVLLCGIADATIALMRVENLLPLFFDTTTVREFGRPQFVGPYVHMPLILLGFLLALVTRTLGFQWLALMIVVAELGIVISRFVFSYEQALMADLVRYWYAALFLFASAYTLFEEGHVRVDVFYAGFGDTTKGFVNAWGSILLGMTTCWVIIAIGFNGKQSLINSPVVNLEITQSGQTGMFIKYQMAAFLGIFAVTMLIQFVSYFFESVADYRREPGHRDVAPTSH